VESDVITMARKNNHRGPISTGMSFAKKKYKFNICVWIPKVWSRQEIEELRQVYLDEGEEFDESYFTRIENN